MGRMMGSIIPKHEELPVIKQKKWSLVAPSGGQIKLVVQVYKYYINPYKIRLLFIFTFNYIMTIFNILGT